MPTIPAMADPLMATSNQNGAKLALDSFNPFHFYDYLNGCNLHEH